MSLPCTGTHQAQIHSWNLTLPACNLVFLLAKVNRVKEGAESFIRQRNKTESLSEIEIIKRVYWRVTYCGYFHVYMSICTLIATHLTYFFQMWGRRKKWQTFWQCRVIPHITQDLSSFFFLSHSLTVLFDCASARVRVCVCLHAHSYCRSSFPTGVCG